MSIALYRKYRPKNFSEVTGKTHIKLTLQNEIKSDKVAHAYLFCGPRGTGKTTLARLLSRSVNCLDLQAEGEPCNKCKNCQDILSGKALDIIEIDAASHTGVDNVRENIIQNARFTPTASKYKVYIIDEVHMLSISAFNALLKILEEPPQYVIFILATTEAHKVPVTIISRCQRFDFKKINIPELHERLSWIAKSEEVRLDDKILRSIAKQSGGCVRDAESLLEQIFSLGENEITLEQAELILPNSDFEVMHKMFDLIIARNTADAIELVDKMVTDGVDMSQFTDSFIEFTRKILLYKINGDLEEISRELDSEMVEQIITQVEKVDEGRLATIIKKFLEAKDYFKQSYIVQLPVELAIFDLTQGSKLVIEPERQSTPPVQPSPQPVVAPAPVQPVAQPEPAVVPSAPAESVQPQPEPAVPEKVESQPEPIAPPVETVPVEDIVVEVATDGGESEKPEEKPVESASEVIAVNNLSDILNHWPKVLSEAKANHYGLFLSLGMAKPIDFAEGVLTIGFLFEIQKKKLEQTQGHETFQKVLKLVYGKGFIVSTRIEQGMTIQKYELEPVSAPVSVDSSISSSPPQPDQANELANEFGGEVIENI